jgi:hypothetical protein
MNKKEKTQQPPEIKKRVSGKKGGTGANFGNIRELPHPAAILFGLAPNISEQKNFEIQENKEVTGNDSSTVPFQPSQPRQSSLTRHSKRLEKSNLSSETTFTKSQEIAPTSNFQKVPNSITKTAIPAGVFKQGKSKQLYDVLYSLTRGSIEPKRSIRISKKEIMRLAGIGSRITFDSGIIHLESVGLLKQTVFTGEHAGNEFEVLLYEEALTLTRQPSQTSLTSHARKVVRLVSLESSQTSQSSIVENKDTYEIPNTSFKTNVNDDEKKAFTLFEKLFETASVELTGKGLQETEKGKWKDLAEILIMELKVAALRTDLISSVPAFLTEHLRRRLWQNDKKQTKSQNRSYNKDIVGKPDAGYKASGDVSDVFTSQSEYVPEPLTETQRETVITSMKEFLEQGKLDFVMSLEKTYSEEDWNWLMKKLPKKTLKTF